MREYKEEFIKFMVESEVLMFGEFTTKSGRKSPYFINTGKYKTGEQIARLGKYYAACIEENIKRGNIKEEITALFGPAYKGIPLAVSTSIAMTEYSKNVNYCFNRKEEKDHGEGGSMVGYDIKPDDNVIIVEDVITAGTAVREVLPLLKNQKKANILGMVVSVDRMEKSTGEKTAIQTLYHEENIKTFPIVTVHDIITVLHNKPIGGKVYIDNSIYEKITNYLSIYG